MVDLDIPNETILLIPDVAAVLKCSEGYVRRLIREGKIAAYQVGKTYRIPRQNLVNYVESLIGVSSVQENDRRSLFSAESKESKQGFYEV